MKALPHLLAAEPVPPWAASVPGGGSPRVAVPPPGNPRFEHLAWPKAVKTGDGTIVLGYLAGTHHGDESCPAVSISTDGAKTFSAPHVLQEFGPGKEYTNSGNMALGLAHDGAVLLLAHGHTKKTNHIFGWRSADGGRTWETVDTAALGPNKTGSATGTIVQLSDKRLMVAGHYRDGSQPYTRGIWQAVSEDDGKTWSAPAMVNNLNAGEPVLVRHGERLLIFARGRGPAAGRQFVSVSTDGGNTWVTDLLNITTIGEGSRQLAHPFVMVHPHQPAQLLAITTERPKPGSAQMWTGDPRKLNFKHKRTLLEFPKVADDLHTDYGYAWLVPLEERRAVMFYYHGLLRGPNPIWALDVEL